MTIRNHFLAFLFINLFVATSYSQSLEGEWKIDNLITYSIQQEYSLTPLDTGIRYDYGNHVKMNEDNSFETWYTAPCGNDCFTTSMGQFSFPDENYIQFRIDTVYRHGDCHGIPDDISFPINSEVFFVYKSKEKLKFIQTTGNLEEDQAVAKYIDSIEINYWESTKFSHLFNWIKPNSELEISPENIADLYRSTIETKNLKVLSSKKMARSLTVVLVEIDDEYNYLFCRSGYTREKEIIQEIAIYDKRLVVEIRKSAVGIEEKLNRFTVENIKNSTEFGEEVNKIYRKNGKIKKVVIEKKYENGFNIMAYYFEKDTPIYIHAIGDVMDMRSKKKYYSETEYFLIGGDLFTAKGKKNVNTSSCEQGYYRCVSFLNAILENE